MGKCVEGFLDFDFFIGNVFWGQFFFGMLVVFLLGGDDLCN